MSDLGAERGKVWPQYLAVLTGTIGFFVTGLHFGWPSPSVPKLLSDEYPFDISREDASYISLIGPLGDVIGSLLAGYTLDLIGRKKTILLTTLPQLLSFAMIALSNFSPLLLYFARLIGGIAEGMCFVAIPMYIGEVAEPRIRGGLGAYISVILLSGVIVVNTIGYYLSITISILVYLPLPVIFFLCFIHMPETPYYCVMKNKTLEAKSALQFLRRKQDVEKEFLGISADVQRQLSEPGTYLDLVRIKSNRKACIALIGLRTVQQLSGIAFFTLYAQMFFMEATDSVPPHVGSILLVLTQTVFSWVCSKVVDKVGRKPLLVWSCVGTSAVLALLGVYFAVRDFSAVDVSMIKWFPVAASCAFMVVFAIGIGSIVNLMLGELFSASIKAKALAVMQIVFALTLLACTKFIQYVADLVGLAVPFLVCMVGVGLGALFCVYCVPETKGKTLEEIQQELKGNK